MDTTRFSLILRLKDVDDVIAWDEFTAIYSAVIYRVAIKRGLQAADAENIVQEVFSAVVCSVAQWVERENRGKFRAWLLRIAHNESVDLMTRKATRSLGKGGDAGYKLMEQIPAPTKLEKMFETEYQNSVFQWASDQVKDTVTKLNWQAFWMTSIEGMPVDKVTQSLGMSRGQVYTAKSRVMAKIKKRVKQFETE
ncbi:MAG: sigma-70 family RNA polymerase sigma factor [Pirellulaceae bacterium]|nr:sigma-70 family RNA polymerase sigma factor [Pirellulaceae bacterium]